MAEHVSLDAMTTSRMSIASAEIKPVISTSVVAPPTATKAIYHEATSIYLSSLSEEVPGRGRLAREQLLRRVTVHVSLACLSTKVEEDNAAADSGAGPSSQPALQNLSRPSQDSQVLSQTNELVPAKSHSVSKDSVRAALDRIARYAKTEDTGSPVSNTSSSVHSILAHWDPTSTPLRYDWMSTVLRLESQAEEAEHVASLTERDRQKLERRRARLAERKSREEERMQSIRSSQVEAPRLVMLSSQLQGSQAPSQRQAYSHNHMPGFGQMGAGAMLPVRSSPARKAREESPSQSLQPVGSQASVAGSSQGSQTKSSQIRGTMGPPLRKKVKRRAEGF